MFSQGVGELQRELEQKPSQQFAFMLEFELEPANKLPFRGFFAVSLLMPPVLMLQDPSESTVEHR